jgi:uncharacterized protein YqgC (DUF456 family)
VLVKPLDEFTEVLKVYPSIFSETRVVIGCRSRAVLGSNVGAVRLFLCVLILASVVACAQNEVDFSNQEVSTTAVGAAAGAAVGAGIGAIVGSATGAAGEGVAIGAVAGAATGGVVGRQFEKQEEQLANQEEHIVRQEEQLKDHRREIDILRGNTSERPDVRSSIGRAVETAKVAPAQGFRIPARNAPSVGSRGGRASISGNAGAVGLASAESQARADERERLRIEARGRLSEGQAYSSANLSTSSGISSGDSFAVSSSNRVAVLSGDRSGVGKVQEQELNLPPRQNTESRAVVASLPVEEEDASFDSERIELGAEEAPPVPAEPTVGGGESGLPPAATLRTPEKTAEVKNEIKTKSLSSDGDDTIGVVKNSAEAKVSSLNESAVECAEGEAEAVRARNATSDADKLFYFRRAIRICPEEPTYHIEVGRVYSSIGKSAEAKESFHKALELDPENEVAQDELSMMMLDNSY